MSEARQEKQLRHARTIRFGQDEEHREAVKKQNETFTDWRARCRVCGEELEGSLAQLRAHRHDPAS